MSVWNKVLLVLIFLCAAAFVYFGADALKMRRDSQKKLVDARKARDDAIDMNRKLLYGTGQDDSYVSLGNEVNRLREFRSTRAWPNCLPTAQAVVRGTTVTLQLQVDATPLPPVPQPDDVQPGDDEDLTAPDPSATPDPSAVPDPGATPDPSADLSPAVPPQDRVLPGTIVYLFDKRPYDKKKPEVSGCLLGEFMVTKVDKDIATLTSVYQMTEAEITRINNSVAQLAPWAVYTVLPREAQVNVASSVTGEPTTDTDIGTEPENDNEAEDMLAEEMPEAFDSPTDDPRPALAQTFASLNHKRKQLQIIVEMLESQQKSLETTQVEATKMVEFYFNEKADTEARLREKLRQFAEVKKLHDATVAEIDSLKELIADLKSMNKKMLADLTQAQLRASEIIHERNASLSMAP